MEAFIALFCGVMAIGFAVIDDYYASAGFLAATIGWIVSIIWKDRASRAEKERDRYGV